MEIKNNDKTIKLELSEDCIDIYVDSKFAGDFSIEEDCGIITIRPNSIDFENINEGRKGHYSAIINSVVFEGLLNDEIDNLFDDVCQIRFESVLRSEKACNFWTKLGYSNTYDIEEHERGQQDVIEINIAQYK